jgi:hypothetical protein
LEGWNMNESPIVAAWRAEGRAEGAIEGRREDILRILRVKFPDEVPDDLVAAVEAQADLDVLARCLDALVTSSSLREYRGNAGL